ncbi:FecR family protein [Thauera sp. 2A1]|uniref:FecR family protein n=1 Tax=Thauera sp. 2A1 TaxID=2570191 RepID=UPI001291DABC|nr:FecR family protein [Thauera sp. 2A1]KAI5913240.1 FecR family protein [Thauera sp. 2A1]
MNARVATPVCVVLRAIAVLLAGLMLAGCAPSLVNVMREDPLRPGRYQSYGGTELAGMVEVWRDGRTLAVKPPAALQPGDVVHTGPDALAVIRYPDGGEIVLDRNTRVRTGSLFVEFGRILARVRGLFEVDTENVVTGVEGTEYVLQVVRGGMLKVVVLEGVVVCRSRTGRWSPMRLQRGEMLLSDYPNRSVPSVQRASPQEWEAARNWIAGIDGAAAGGQAEPARIGYCCERGRLRRSAVDDCRGFFSASEREAAARCEQPRPDEPQNGYCCSDGRLSATSRDRCSGRFFVGRDEAAETCRPAEERGYCCDRGKLFETVRDRCERAGGEFFTSGARAEAVCRRAEQGYCCNRGQVRASTRERCESVKGRFYRDPKAAARACHVPRAADVPNLIEQIKPLPQPAPPLQ